MDDMHNYCTGYVNLLFSFWSFFSNCRVFVAVATANPKEDSHSHFLKHLIKHFEKKLTVL